MKEFKKYLLLLCFAMTYSASWGQDDIDQFLEANIEDAELLTANYLSPLIKGFGYGVNNGWYNTAKPHAKGFDLTLTVTAAFVPDKDLFTDFIPGEYQDLELVTPVDGRVPTVFGSENIEPGYLIPSTGQTFAGPAGNSLENEIGFNAVPVPMIQLGIGVIRNTDVKVRFFPTTDFEDDVEVKMWGGGIMHRLNDYFPLGDQMLVDVSLFGGFTHIDSEIRLSDTFPGENQFGTYQVNAWTFEGVVSYEYSVLTFYGSLGYHSVRSDLDILGTYDTGSEILVDPISTNFNTNGLRGTAGLRLKLAVVTLHGDYTFSEYNLLTVGFGINVN